MKMWATLYPDEVGAEPVRSTLQSFLTESLMIADPSAAKAIQEVAIMILPSFCFSRALHKDTHLILGFETSKEASSYRSLCETASSGYGSTPFHS